ncbi:hypothetical protein NUH86_20800 [Sphingobium sp. JS3065]|jgi:signal transduction histidine kinase|uniref:hypothetical protein n=1 Tax=Sphingobium sp. JS3065 TaxID=2970925 RepID=UPI0022655E68|nr:hypothetical protein [Sphingobium sp. JS3065]UZW57165.1 hypothetical protein NUH86_20800 [Sphingobium sp. JS3065]
MRLPGWAMMRLLNDILDLSKVEAGQMEIAHEPFDLVHALEACLNLVRARLSARNGRKPLFMSGIGSFFQEFPKTVIFGVARISGPP